ncbi:response regulator transcription factor [Undibacterium sp. Ji50W]|uniref:response regulator transcription factor n=1 Tax=Undibacterium sp. Ji50W TaxID=3413041 RepID=UPI003BEFAD06
MGNKTTWVAIVDDEESIRRALLRLFRSVGLEAQAFRSGQGFLSSLQHTMPSCVVMDLHMPEMSGFAVLEELKTYAPDLPVVIMTAHQINIGQLESSLSTAIAVLQKPVNDDVLLDAITKATKPPELVAAENVKEN